ncbi:MAG: hypothetical protein IKN77_04450 [Paludibacteraceae bacterium]|nr:hypothetical protein [Paludibacteraceae bacterium]
MEVRTKVPTSQNGTLLLTKNLCIMSLSAPKQIIWIIAVILGVLGILGYFIAIPFVSANGFWLVSAAFALLAISTLVKGL